MSTDTRVNSSAITDSTFSTDGPPNSTNGTSIYIAIDGASILSNIKLISTRISINDTPTFSYIIRIPTAIPTDGTPTPTAISTDDTSISTDDIPISTDGTPISTDDTPISTDDTPISTDDTPISTDDTPISTDGTPISTDDTPISTDDTPISTDGHVPTDGTIITDIDTIDTSFYHEIFILAQFLKDIINSTMFHKKHSVYAVYRLQDTSNDLPFEEVAFGSGTQWEKRITKDSKVNLEDIIWDSHAEVIANQSFRRYLVSQMKNLISGTKQSIFEYDRSSSSSTNTVWSSPLPCLKLRFNFRIHLYISKVPCGGAAHCLNPGRSATDGTTISTEGTPISTEGTPISTEGTPISTEGTPISTEGTPISTEGTPISTEGTPNSTDDTPMWEFRLTP
ncbi:hypothetical protein EMCRGX_G008146 [Ephydatia muelleri]